MVHFRRMMTLNSEPKKWKECSVANLDTIRKIAESKSFTSLVWEKEGRMVGKKWQFDENHKDFQPLLLDLNSARLIIQAYTGAPALRMKIEQLIGTRAGFIKLSEILWKNAKFGS